MTIYDDRGKCLFPKELAVWRAIRTRCISPLHKEWSRYGGRGITICDKWIDSFESFLRDVGPRPSRLHTIDRIDNDKGYEIGNVRWATWVENARNRHNNVLVLWEGKKITVAELCEKTGKPYTSVMARIRLGWSVEDAIARPIRARKLGSNFEWNGKKTTLHRIAIENGVNDSSLRLRMSRGLTIEQAISLGKRS